MEVRIKVGIIKKPWNKSQKYQNQQIINAAHLEQNVFRRILSKPCDILVPPESSIFSGSHVQIYVYKLN